MNILARHALTISMISRDKLTLFLLRDYFDLPRREALMSALLSRGLGQADLVLAILHLRDQSHSPDWRRLWSFYVRQLVGRPILVGEPCLLRWKTNSQSPRVCHPRSPGDRRVTWVQPTNPRQPQTDAYHRWSEFRPGRTVAQLLSRGVTRKDLRAAVRRNWIRLEEIA